VPHHATISNQICVKSGIGVACAYLLSITIFILIGIDLGKSYAVLSEGVCIIALILRVYKIQIPKDRVPHDIAGNTWRQRGVFFGIYRKREDLDCKFS
jgi:hypothetical protein